MSLALAAVIGGSFSRMGYGQRIAAVAVAALVTRVLGFVVESASGSTPALNAAQYAIPIGVTVAALAALFVRRQRAKRRRSPILAGAPAQAVA
jgi:lipopolysaccharide export system permease protein